ncbi:MAG: tripartite tricarboxylate transporter substrate binding protein [Spirochaetia bacterium]|jgi:tripartite-type tricarboxylate transporter receptor subunit TctC|nr:tripartite tricarboxylate transporter substrate binding protein [Spirochaetia bacterium]
MKKHFLAVIAAGLMLMPLFANGEGEQSAKASSSDKWPSQTIDIVVPFSAGGNSDYNTRTIAKYLKDELGQSIVVSNVSGSGGTIGASQVLHAKSDGYTILCTQLSMNMAQVTGMVDYGFADFGGGCVFSRSADEVLVVRGDSKWNTFDDFVADAKANPGKLKLAANTGASTQWIAVAMLNAGIPLNVVSSGGSGERLQLVLGKHVDMVPLPLTMVSDYVAKGELKILATDSPKRGELIPDVPTLQEKGVACAYYYDNTFLFPKGTDQAIVDKFSKACEKVITTNEAYRKEIAAYKQVPTYMDPSATAESYKTQLASLMKIKDQLIGK